MLAALLFSLAFALGYPVFVTIDAQAQTGFRYTYLYSAWSETLGMTEQNVSVRPVARPALRGHLALRLHLPS